MGTCMFAHRGLSAQYPENTLAAFQAAADAGADGIELDVQLSKDLQAVVIHDHSLERTTTGTGFVKEYELQQLKEFDAGSWFAPPFANETIPALADVLTWAKGNQLLLNIELKGQVWERSQLKEAVLPLVFEHELQERVIFSSFDHRLIYEIQKQEPQLETAILVAAALHEPERYLRDIGVRGYHFRVPFLLQEEAVRLQQHGVQLRPYTVNDPYWVEMFVKWGCAGLFTDDPVMALQLRKKYEG
ncbi:glycerophosphodiester phosphodiesterase family protein [Halalkalibacter oceani]|uniref:Glycerophosphodiester phosphodiesterase n=1 Tax=Halalkalibacter oceani TaxID=1653776 RepID=A0A9X2IMP3_9BACI|nr:glycerophosphodiester phosphodiesterase family protein [Halalkalibacter oceani]MCM3712582.1 glycerophosphodiester phosphodiesterase [Halalkalibacter oceani]